MLPFLILIDVSEKFQVKYHPICLTFINYNKYFSRTFITVHMVKIYTVRHLWSVQGFYLHRVKETPSLTLTTVIWSH